MKTVNLLDAHAILKYFKKERGYKTVCALLKAAQIKKTGLIMSEINMGEVYYQLHKAENLLQPNHVWNLFLLLPITRCIVDFSLVIEAAKLKSLYSLSSADCFAAATAIRENADIVTGDPDFKKLEKLVKIVWV